MTNGSAHNAPAAKVPPHVALKRRLGTYLRKRNKMRDNPEVRQARFLAARLEQGPIDVLHLGASESLFTADYDEDKRTLPQMIAEGLPDGLQMHSVAGAGYHPALFKQYVDIAAARGSRPLVIVGLCIRLGEPAWKYHPEYSYSRPLNALHKIDVAAPSKKFRAVVPLAKQEDFDEHDKREHPTVVGTRTIGEFRRLLKNPESNGLTRDETVKLLLAYHLGATGDLEPEYLADATALGKRLRELDLPVVCYQMPLPIDQAAAVLGEEVRPHMLRRLKDLDDAFKAGYGDDVEIVQSGSGLVTEDFIDPNDGSEHVNEKGRRKITDDVLAAIARRRAR